MHFGFSLVEFLLSIWQYQPPDSQNLAELFENRSTQGISQRGKKSHFYGLGAGTKEVSGMAITFHLPLVHQIKWYTLVMLR